MERQEVIADHPVAVAGVTLIPGVKVSLKHWRGSGNISCFGAKQLVSVIVVSPSGKMAFRVTGEEVTVDQVIQEVPSLKEILERI